MACTAFDRMRLPSESLNEMFLHRPHPDDLWLGAIPKTTYQLPGVTQTGFIVENSEPLTDSENWVEVAQSVGTENTTPGCDVTYNAVDVGYTEFTYGPRKFGLKGPAICKDNLKYQFESKQFLMDYFKQLEHRSKRSWCFEMRNRYQYFAPKYTATAGVPISDTSTAITALGSQFQPDSELTMDILDTVAGHMNENGVYADLDDNGIVSLGPEGPLYTLVIGQEMSNRLYRTDSARRIDVREAEPSELLKRVGASRITGNFRHAVTVIPPRYNFVDGSFVSVPTFVQVATSKGYKNQINPAWRGAAFEAAIVLTPYVFEAQIVPDLANFGNAASFNPTSHLGKWEFIVGAHRIGLDCDDPYEKWGTHFCEFEYAPKPRLTEKGGVILFRRCVGNETTSYCS